MNDLEVSTLSSLSLGHGATMDISSIHGGIHIFYIICQGQNAVFVWKSGDNHSVWEFWQRPGLLMKVICYTEITPPNVCCCCFNERERLVEQGREKWYSHTAIYELDSVSVTALTNTFRIFPPQVEVKYIKLHILQLPSLVIQACTTVIN